VFALFAEAREALARLVLLAPCGMLDVDQVAQLASQAPAASALAAGGARRITAAASLGGEVIYADAERLGKSARSAPGAGEVALLGATFAVSGSERTIAAPNGCKACGRLMRRHPSPQAGVCAIDDGELRDLIDEHARTRQQDEASEGLASFRRKKRNRLVPRLESFRQ